MTYASTVTLTQSEDEAPERIVPYAYVANETREMSDRVAADLGPDVYGDVRTEDAIESLITIEAFPEIGTMTLTAVGQPSEDVARAVLERYSAYIIGYALDKRSDERDVKVEANETRIAELDAGVNALTAELDQLEAALTPEQREAGVSPNRAKSVQLEVDIENLTTLRTETQALRALTDEELTPLQTVGFPTVSPEQAPSDPLGASGRMVVGLSLAALLGIGLAITLHRFDTRLFSRKDVEAAFRLPVLAEVPKLSWMARRNETIITRSNPSHPVSEAYRLLRSGLELARSRQLKQLGEVAPGRGTSILVASASAAVGRTTATANLAVAMVDTGKRVLVVGGDLRNPGIHELLGVSDTAAGLSDAVRVMASGTAQIDLSDYITATEIDGVALLPQGQHAVNPGETLAAARPLIEAARFHFDVVLIDSPPMLVGNDVSELAPVSDLVLLVARTNRTTIDEGRWVDETAERLQLPTCGVLLIGARSDLERQGALKRPPISSRLRQSKRHGERGEATPMSSSPVMVPLPGHSGEGSPSVRAAVIVGGTGGQPAGPGQPVVDVASTPALAGPSDARTGTPAEPGPAAQAGATHPAPVPFSVAETGPIPVIVPRQSPPDENSEAGKAEAPGATDRAGQPAQGSRRVPDISDIQFDALAQAAAQADQSVPPSDAGGDATAEVPVNGNGVQIEPTAPPANGFEPPDQGGVGQSDQAPPPAESPRVVARPNDETTPAADSIGDRIPKFADDLDDEDEPTADIVRVTSARTAGPASRSTGG